MLKGLKEYSADIKVIPLIKIDRIYHFDLAMYIRMRNSDIYKLKFDKNEAKRRILQGIKRNTKLYYKQKVIIDEQIQIEKDFLDAYKNIL